MAATSWFCRKNLAKSAEHWKTTGTHIWVWSFLFCSFLTLFFVYYLFIFFLSFFFNIFVFPPIRLKEQNPDSTEDSIPHVKSKGFKAGWKRKILGHFAAKFLFFWVFCWVSVFQLFLFCLFFVFLIVFYFQLFFWIVILFHFIFPESALLWAF